MQESLLNCKMHNSQSIQMEKEFDIHVLLVVTLWVGLASIDALLELANIAARLNISYNIIV